MKLKAVLASDMSGNPKIKVTKDTPQITLDVYSQDLNLLRDLEGKEITLEF